MTPGAGLEAPIRDGRKAANLRHRKAIADKMAPDPREWEYAGECVDLRRPTGTCTCGHVGIRWVFTIRRPRDGATLPIGRVCIQSTVPFLIQAGADNLAEQLEAAEKDLAEKIAEDLRRKRDAEADLAVAALLEDLEALRRWRKAGIDLIADTWRRRGGRRPWYPEVLYTNRFRTGKVCSSPGRTAAALRTRLSGYWRAAFLAADNPEQSPRLPYPPAPREGRLVERIVDDIAAWKSEGRISRAVSALAAEPPAIGEEMES